MEFKQSQVAYMACTKVQKAGAVRSHGHLIGLSLPHRTFTYLRGPVSNLAQRAHRVLVGAP